MRKSDSRYDNLHFLNKSGIRLWIHSAFVATHCGARMEEIDTQIGVVTFDGLRNVLDGRYVKGHWYTKHRHYHRFVLLIWMMKYGD